MNKPKTAIYTYLKLSEYMIPYVYRRYGKPIVFSPDSVMYKLLSSSLRPVDNLDVKYSNVSCSHRAYCTALAKRCGHISEESAIGTPSGEDIEQFVPIVMPSTVMTKDEERDITISVATGPTHTITLQTAQKLRQLIRQQFWSDLSQYNKDYATGATHKQDIFRFLRIHNIPVEQFENICRAETRLTSEM